MDFSPLAWTDGELEASILKLCDEFPDASMVTCSRAVDHCRRTTPQGTPDVLLTAMRDFLRHEVAAQRPLHIQAA